MEQPQPTSSPEWEMNTKRVISVIGFGFLVAFIFYFRGILPLVFTSIVLAYLFNPVANFFQNQTLSHSRTASVGLTFLLVILIFILVLLFVLPAMVEQIQAIVAGTPAFLTSVQEQTTDLLTDEIDFTNTPLERFAPEPVTLAELLNIETDEDGRIEFFTVFDSQLENFDPATVIPSLTSSLTNVTGSTFRFVGGAVSIVLNVIFLLTMTFYLMVDGKNMINAMENGIPEGYRSDFRVMLRELGHVWNSYLRGQVILSLIMGGAMYIMARILGIPNAIFLGIFAGLMEFVPNLGPTLVMIPTAGIALFSTSSTIPGLSGFAFAVVVVIAWTLLQQIEAVVLVPRIVGDSLNLHPFVILVAVLAGISVGGIFAVLIAAPVAASLRLIGQYVYGKLTGRSPFPVDRKTAEEARRERRPLLVRIGDWCARWVRNLVSSRTVTKRSQ